MHMPPRRAHNPLPLDRRKALQIGGAGLLGLNMPRVFEAAARTGSIKPRAKHVIFLFQWGGPSHIDMFDRKPKAADNIRSPLQSISTSVPGLETCAGLEETAKWFDRVTLIRSMTHTMTNHNSAGYYALTGHAPPSDDQRLRDGPELWPAYGSIVDHIAPATGVPTFVAYPHVVRDGSATPGQHASFLGKKHDPLFFREDPNADDFRLPELSLPQGLSLDRLDRRRQMQKLIDQQAKLLDHSVEARGLSDYYDKAVSLLTSDKIRSAFDLSHESAATRQRYGRTTYGQSCLLARRLVEAGVKFVNVYFAATIGGRTTSDGWDTHGFDNTRMYEIIPKYHLPITDQTLPALLSELDERGLWDDTLVVWMGEFGRTPKINASKSRDHWPHCYTVLLAGGGVKKGFVYGASDSQGAYPEEHPVRPDDLAATIYHLLGIDPDFEVYDRADRPLVVASGKPIYDVME